jgi:hypothetical protein
MMDSIVSRCEGLRLSVLEINKGHTNRQAKLRITLRFTFGRRSDVCSIAFYMRTPFLQPVVCFYVPLVVQRSIDVSSFKKKNP